MRVRDRDRGLILAILAGRHETAEPSTMDALALAVMAAQVRPTPARGAALSAPLAMAASIGLRVVSVRDVPFGSACDARTIYVPGMETGQTLGLGIARGIAAWALTKYAGAHSTADAVLLAAEIVAPAAAIRGDSIQTLVARQPGVPPWFLAGWLERVTRASDSQDIPAA